MSITIRAFRPDDAMAYAELYATCFAEPPWYERFNLTEVAREIAATNAATDTIVLIAQNDDQVVGGAVGVPLKSRPDIHKLITCDLEVTYYFAELFVSSNCRRMGIAQALIKARSRLAQAQGFTCAAVRTSVAQTIIQDIYLARNMKIVAGQEVNSLKFINGVAEEVPDERVILFGPI